MTCAVIVDKGDMEGLRFSPGFPNHAVLMAQLYNWLCRCPGWSESLLGAQLFGWYCHEVAHSHALKIKIMWMNYSSQQFWCLLLQIWIHSAAIQTAFRNNRYSNWKIMDTRPRFIVVSTRGFETMFFIMWIRNTWTIILSKWICIFCENSSE